MLMRTTSPEQRRSARQFPIWNGDRIADSIDLMGARIAYPRNVEI